MGRKHKDFPEENTSKETQLRKKVKELESEVRRLKGELKTLNAAFEKTGKFIKDNTDGITVEKMIESIRENKTLREIKKEHVCPECGSEVREDKIPIGSIRLCLAACGYREVIRNEKK
jgi:DNA repair exonuclease SbcCD ATPase subunit